jgi:hypothetical protein
VDRDKVQALLSLAEQYLAEATAIIQRQEHLIRELERSPDEPSAAEALVETFRAAAQAMTRHQQSLEQQLRHKKANGG